MGMRTARRSENTLTHAHAYSLLAAGWMTGVQIPAVIENTLTRVHAYGLVAAGWTTGVRIPETSNNSVTHVHDMHTVTGCGLDDHGSNPGNVKEYCDTCTYI
jgi:predicted TIM-barrel enzyme